MRNSSRGNTVFGRRISDGLWQQQKKENEDEKEKKKGGGHTGQFYQRFTLSISSGNAPLSSSFGRGIMSPRGCDLNDS